MNRFLISSLVVGLVGSSVLGVVACGSDDPENPGVTGGAGGSKAAAGSGGSYAAAGAPGFAGSPASGGAAGAPSGGGSAGAGGGSPMTKTIFELATEGGKLTKLLEAIKAANPDVGALLKDKIKTLTVFAPGDDAFNGFPQIDKSQACFKALKANTVLLTSILKYHVLPKVVLPQDFESTSKATELPNQMLPIKVTGQKVEVGPGAAPALVVVKEIPPAANGKVYIINKLLIPESEVKNLPAECKLAVTSRFPRPASLPRPGSFFCPGTMERPYGTRNPCASRLPGSCRSASSRTAFALVGSFLAT